MVRKTWPGLTQSCVSNNEIVRRKGTKDGIKIYNILRVAGELMFYGRDWGNEMGKENVRRRKQFRIKFGGACGRLHCCCRVTRVYVTNNTRAVHKNTVVVYILEICFSFNCGTLRACFSLSQVYFSSSFSGPETTVLYKIRDARENSKKPRLTWKIEYKEKNNFFLLKQRQKL